METRPEAKSCIPFCPGLQAEFGTYKKYYEFVKKRENQDKHKQLFDRLLSKNDLQQATQLSTARTLGGKFVVHQAGWDSSKHGEWDPAKVGSEALAALPRSRSRASLQRPGFDRGSTQIGSGAQSSGSAAKEPASGQGSAVAVDSSESGEADGSESGDSGDEDMTGMSFWGTTAKAKEPKAKPKPVAKVAAAPKGTGNSKTKRGAQGAKKCSRSEPASSTKGEEKESRQAAKKREGREGIQAPSLPISFTEPIAGMQLGPQV